MDYTTLMITNEIDCANPVYVQSYATAIDGSELQFVSGLNDPLTFTVPDFYV